MKTVTNLTFRCGDHLSRESFKLLENTPRRNRSSTVNRKSDWIMDAGTTGGILGTARGLDSNNQSRVHLIGWIERQTRTGYRRSSKATEAPAARKISAQCCGKGICSPIPFDLASIGDSLRNIRKSPLTSGEAGKADEGGEGTGEIEHAHLVRGEWPVPNRHIAGGHCSAADPPPACGTLHDSSHVSWASSDSSSLPARCPLIRGILTVLYGVMLWVEPKARVAKRLKAES